MFSVRTPIQPFRRPHPPRLACILDHFLCVQQCNQCVSHMRFVRRFCSCWLLACVLRCLAFESKATECMHLSVPITAKHCNFLVAPRMEAQCWHPDRSQRGDGRNEHNRMSSAEQSYPYDEFYVLSDGVEDLYQLRVVNISYTENRLVLHALRYSVPVVVERECYWSRDLDA